jgi:AraC-like DNA-binding protein
MAEGDPTSNSPPFSEVESGGKPVPAAMERRGLANAKREGQSSATNSIALMDRSCYFDLLPTLPGILPMARPARKQRSSSQRCAGLLSRIAYRYAARHGVDVAPLLAQAGVSQKEIEDQSATIGVANQIKFVELIAAKLGDEFLGFHLAEDFEFGEIGLLYYVAASAATFGGAVSRIERYIKIQNDGVDFEVIRGKTLRLRLHYTGVARHTDVHQIGSVIALMIRIGRHLTGRPLKPTRVRIMHHIHRGKAKLEKLLDADVEDGARVDEVEFPAASWDLPIVSADPYLHQLCVQSCEEALARRGLKQTPLKVQVENAIAALLPHGQARHELVAAQLGMSPRTLARRLAEEGTSFAGLLTEVRSALADRYLAERSLPISQIAWLLGYAEISGFTRAFRRWTGTAPSAARARQLAPDVLLME